MIKALGNNALWLPKGFFTPFPWGYVMELAEIAAILTIFSPVGLAILLFTYLKWKINQLANDQKDRRQDYREIERRLRDVEMKVYAYNLVESIIDKIGEKRWAAILFQLI